MPRRDATTVRSGTTSVKPEAGKEGTRRRKRGRFVGIRTREKFDRIAQGNPDVLAYITAKWCGACKRTWPEVLSVIGEMEKEARPVLVKVDVDTNEWAGEEFDLVAVPTLVHLRHGEVVSKKVGPSEMIPFLQVMKDRQKSRRTKVPSGLLRDFLLRVQESSAASNDEFGFSVDLFNDLGIVGILEERMVRGSPTEARMPKTETAEITGHTHSISRDSLAEIESNLGTRFDDVSKKTLCYSSIPSPGDVFTFLSTGHPSNQVEIVASPGALIFIGRTTRSEEMKNSVSREGLRSKLEAVDREFGVRNPPDVGYKLNYGVPLRRFEEHRAAYLKRIEDLTGLEVSIHAIDDLPELDLVVHDK